MPELIKCTINDKSVEVKKGSTIIQAFKELNQDIAHYCWHPGLSVAGVCRLCMVHIEGAPKLQIACNTEVREGMVITNESQAVKETVRWGLDFHLINHPLDCPICDQSGECGLQEQYMKFGQYDPEMGERKVKKRKVVDLGSKIVLDTERCILCSRCVRFTDEVSQTHELGIFNRGDRSEIGTVQDKPLENDYALNTVDICPVGALTSKDFRFRQRVWYLKNTDTVCSGCSTGCNIKVYYNEDGLFRVKPIHNEEINGYWMCDKGREVYKFVNKENRLLTGKINEEKHSAGHVAKMLSSKLREKCAVVITGQYFCEEYKDFFEFLNSKNITEVYHWKNNLESFEDFDGLLLRGDKNPNTKGLLRAASEANISFKPWPDLLLSLKSQKIKNLIVVGPENVNAFPDLQEKLCEFSQAQNLIWLTSALIKGIENIKNNVFQIPIKTYIEKSGTFINHSGQVQSLKSAFNVVAGALTLSDVACLFNEKEITIEEVISEKKPLKTNFFTYERGEI